MRRLAEVYSADDSRKDYTTSESLKNPRSIRDVKDIFTHHIYHDILFRSPEKWSSPCECLPEGIRHIPARGSSKSANRLFVDASVASQPQTALTNKELSDEARNGTTSRINLFQAVNAALAHALRSDQRVLLFGEDVAFGGVFRCSLNLATEFGDARVFNTPLSEQGIVGFAIGAAMEGMKPIAEVQFADYVFPAFDQIVNEAAKCRYRAGVNGDTMSAGGMVVRMPTGAVGHGALYHSQSPESLFSHIPGMRVVIPRSPSQAKGLLLGAIASNDPVIFMEPKILYRAAVEHVPAEPYTLPLSKAEVLKEGNDVTIVSYGTPLYLCQAALEAAEKDFKCSVELIDLRTIYPWDRQTVVGSVQKTGRCIVVHESMVNAGVGAEVAATVQEGCFLRLEAPIQRVAGWSTHSGLAFEKFNIPDVTRIYDSIRTTLEY